MAFALEAGETLAGSLRRIVEEQLSSAAQELAEVTAPDPVVHSTRKRLKRLRAVLRMVEPGLKPRIFRAELGELREIARWMGQARDSAVRLALLDELRADLGELDALETLRGAAAARHTLLHEEHFARQDVLGRVRAALSEVQTRLPARIEVPRADEVMVAGIGATYREGRRRWRQVVRRPSTEALHRWRRWVKHLWYQLDVLTPARPRVIGPLVKRLDALGDLLGRDHDLANQAELLGDAASEEVQEALHARQAQAQAQAFALAEIVYAERPRELRRRLTLYLDAFTSAEREARIARFEARRPARWLEPDDAEAPPAHDKA